MAASIFLLFISGLFLVAGLFLVIADLGSDATQAAGDPAWVVGMAFVGLSTVVIVIASLILYRALRDRKLPTKPVFIPPAPVTLFSRQKAQRWIWIFAPLVVGGAAAGLVYAWMTQPGETLIVGLFATGFTLGFFLLLYHAYRKLLAWYRFGPVPLHIQQHPLILGGDLDARLEVPGNGAAAPVFRVELVCESVHFVRVRSHDGDSTEERASRHWSTGPVEITGRPAPGHVRVNIHIGLPDGQPATCFPGMLGTSARIERGLQYFRWHLHVTSESGEVRFERDYPVEVQEPREGIVRRVQAEAPEAEGMPADQQKLHAIVEKVAAAELEKGLTPEQVWDRMSGRRLAPEVLLGGLAGLSAKPGFVHAGVLRDFVSRKSGSVAAEPGNPLEEQEDGCWDPLGQRIRKDYADQRAWDEDQDLREIQAGAGSAGRKMLRLTGRMGRKRGITELRETLQHFRENPRELKRKLWATAAVPAVTTGLTAWFHDPLLGILARAADQGDARVVLLIPFAIPYFYIRRVYDLQTDLVKLEVADENDWVYSPDRDGRRGSLFNRRYANLFTHKDRERPETEDEFWGTYQANRQVMPFWTGLFHYQVESRVRVNKQRRVRKHVWTAVALPLNRRIPHTLLLRAQPLRLRWLRRLFRRRVNLNTASAEFNRRFDVYRDGVEQEDRHAILRILTPAVQVRLLDLHNEEGEFAFYFDHEAIVFIFHGRLMKGMQTDFFRSIELAPEDRTRVQERLDHVLSLSGDIVPFLD